MSSFNLRRFSNPETLRSIHPRSLVEFLQPFNEYFAVRQFVLPDLADSATIDFEQLASILVDATPETPRELVDALYYVHEMATPEGMNALADAAHDAGIPLQAEDLTPADIAIHLWLAAPHIVEQQHDRQYVDHLRSFECFPSTARKVPRFRAPSSDALRAIEVELGEWFGNHKRGTACRISMFPADDEVLFLVRHGHPLRREGTVNAGEESTLLYRPLKFDVLAYDIALADLRINAETVGEKKLYRTVFGKRLFGDPFYFGDSGKYTLEPLRVDGDDSLRCDDVDDIDAITLVEVHYFWPGSPHEVAISKSTNIFELLRKRGRPMPKKPIKAGFSVAFTGAKRPRKVTIAAPNRVSCQRDDLDAVNQWLMKRGFALKKQDDESTENTEAVEAVLERH